MMSVAPVQRRVTCEVRPNRVHDERPSLPGGKTPLRRCPLGWGRAHEGMSACGAGVGDAWQLGSGPTRPASTLDIRRGDALSNATKTR